MKIGDSEIYPYIKNCLEEIQTDVIKKGDYVTKAISGDDTIYYILKGSVRVVKETMTGKRIFMDSCGAENFTGHISNLGNYDLNCDILAETDLTVLKLDKKIMQHLMEDEAFECFYYKKVSVHLYTMVKRFMLKTLFPQKALIAYYILDNEYRDYFVYKSMYRNCENLRISRAGFYNAINQMVEDKILEKDEVAGGYRILNREALELQAKDVRKFLEREEES